MITRMSESGRNQVDWCDLASADFQWKYNCDKVSIYSVVLRTPCSYVSASSDTEVVRQTHSQMERNGPSNFAGSIRSHPRSFLWLTGYTFVCLIFILHAKRLKLRRNVVCFFDGDPFIRLATAKDHNPTWHEAQWANVHSSFTMNGRSGASNQGKWEYKPQSQAEQ